MLRKKAELSQTPFTDCTHPVWYFGQTVASFNVFRTKNVTDSPFTAAVIVTVSYATHFAAIK